MHMQRNRHFHAMQIQNYTSTTQNTLHLYIYTVTYMDKVTITGNSHYN